MELPRWSDGRAGARSRRTNVDKVLAELVHLVLADDWTPETAAAHLRDSTIDARVLTQLADRFAAVDDRPSDVARRAAVTLEVALAPTTNRRVMVDATLNDGALANGRRSHRRVHGSSGREAADAVDALAMIDDAVRRVFDIALLLRLSAPIEMSTSTVDAALQKLDDLVQLLHAQALRAAATASQPPDPRIDAGRHELAVAQALSTRERDVLDLLITPGSYRDIARDLFISVNTVKAHIAHIYAKLGATTRREAINHARTAGLLPATEAQLREERERFEALVVHSADLITVIDADRRLVWASPSFRNLLGEDAQQHLDRPAWEIVHPRDRARVAEIFAAASRPGEAVSFQCRLAHADGSWRPFDVRQVNCLDDPAVRGFIGNARPTP